MEKKENIVLAKFDLTKMISDAKYEDYAIIKDNYSDVDIYVKHNENTYLVIDSSNKEFYFMPKLLVSKLETGRCDTEDIINLLTKIYRAYEGYRSFLQTKIGKIINTPSSIETKKSLMNEAAIESILSELLRIFNYDAISKVLEDKNDEEIVDLFYIDGKNCRKKLENTINDLVSEITDYGSYDASESELDDSYGYQKTYTR